MMREDGAARSEYCRTVFVIQVGRLRMFRSFLEWTFISKPWKDNDVNPSCVIPACENPGYVSMSIEQYVHVHMLPELHVDVVRPTRLCSSAHRRYSLYHTSSTLADIQCLVPHIHFEHIDGSFAIAKSNLQSAQSLRNSVKSRFRSPGRLPEVTHTQKSM